MQRDIVMCRANVAGSARISIKASRHKKYGGEEEMKNMAGSVSKARREKSVAISKRKVASKRRKRMKRK